LECLIFIVGAYLYYSATIKKNKTGEITFWSLLVFLLVIYFANIFGPPPPSEDSLGYVGLSQWILIGWGYRIDRNRNARE